MSTTEVAGNKVAVRQFCDAMNTGDAQEISKTIDALVAPNAVISTPLPLEATGAELLKQAFTSLLRAYPDLRIEIDDVIAEGDKVVARNTVTGTHQGEHMGIAPTGRAVTYNEIFILRFADGLITETWGIIDALAQMKQLGAIAA
jgi:predicted ester cyclase